MKNYILGLLALTVALFAGGQTCPTSGNTSLSTNPNTYYPGTTANVAVGGTSITLGAGTGPSGIAIGDLVLIIQMQGAEINSTNSNVYGDGVAGLPANGYLNNANHRAGNMEFAVAASNVPVGGGTLTLASGTVNAYQNSAASGTVGQYRYQVIRVPVYFNATLTASLSAPAWNGSTGGVLAIQARNNFSFGGFSLSANGAGFRGGGGRQLGGGSGGASTDFRTAATNNYNGAKGEGTAGTPRYLNNGGSLLDNIAEGYPNGSKGQGAPGNAGGGSTDGNPGSNDENSGGGGGGNGGTGGKGGNTWNSGLSTGGESGATFAQRAANRLVMGGGGGAGTTNNGTGTPGSGFAASGAAGGGIVILYARTITAAGTINVNGTNANNSVLNDGSGGGGAGGSVLVFAGSGHNLITASANGGSGGTNTGGGSPHGPGGGGGGGVIISNGTLNAATTVTAGNAGTTSGGGVFGAANGTAGVLIQNATTPQYPNLSNNCILLPVSLRDFSVQASGPDALLQWQSENEQDFRGYGVERSTDGSQYQSLGFVNGRGTASLQLYQFTDRLALNRASLLYYRLRMQDADGSYRYSPVRTLQTTAAGSFRIWPTTLAAGEPVHLQLSASNSEWIQLRILNSAGQEIRRETLRTGQLHTLTTPSLGSGIYLLELTGRERKEVQKIIVQ